MRSTKRNKRLKVLERRLKGYQELMSKSRYDGEYTKPGSGKRG